MNSTLSPVILNEARHEIPRQCLNASKARERLGWRADYGLDQGLGSTIDWYREYFDGT
jgi:CDP-glucose 4,6-dehydratase